MATVNVKIIYTGAIVDEIRNGAEIARYFLPNNSYVDTPVFTKGYANEEGVGDGKSYGKSIYATNVEGWGSVNGPHLRSRDMRSRFTGLRWLETCGSRDSTSKLVMRSLVRSRKQIQILIQILILSNLYLNSKRG